MMSKEKASELAEECLDEMYRASEPAITLKEIIKKYGGTKIEFYKKHAISQTNYDKISKKYYKQIPKVYHSSFAMTLLDYSPTIKEWKNDHKSKGKKR